MAAGEGGETWRARNGDERKSADRSCNTDRGRASEGDAIPALRSNRGRSHSRATVGDGRWRAGDVRVELGSTEFGGGRRHGVKPPDVGRSASTPDGRLNSLAIVREEFYVFRPTAPIDG